MSDLADKAKAIFLDAVEKHAPEQWAAYLDEACAGDASLRALVDKLLHARAQLGSFHEAPRSALVATIDEPLIERPGSAIGPYKLLEQIGEGGFGVVFMAEQTQPVRRKVALKILKPGMDTRQVVARFEAERQALAIMDHPNIARIFDGDETASGRPYFVMELVRGVPITDFCDQNLLPVRERLGLFVSVCQAVQHAHQKGIIHRDLKPSNVLVTLHDGTPVVKVIDFGVAKALGQQLTDKTLFTNFAQMVGTPLYMSPEQAEMSGLDVDTRSDIYSLGVLLYELLTGTTPLDKERLRTAAYDEIRRCIREEEAVRPSTRLTTLGKAAATVSANRGSDPKRLRQLFRGELDWVVMKALDKDRNRRYESASALAADVRRYLADEPVQACPPSARYRLRKFARRHKVALTMAAVVVGSLVVLVAVLVGSTVLIWRANQDLQQALAREQDITYFQRIALAERELAAVHGARAEELLDLCPQVKRGWEWHFLKRRLLEEPLTPGRHLRSVGGVAFSSDGRLLASADYAGTVDLWDPRSGALVRSLSAQPGNLARVAISWDSQRLAASRWNGPITVWDLAADRSRLLEGQFNGVAFSPDGRYLASGARDGTVIVWDLLTDEKRVFSGHRDIVHDVAYSPDGTRLASASGDWRALVWDVRTGQPLFDLTEHKDAVNCVTFSQDGRYLATGGEDRTVRIWSTATGSEVQVLRGHNHSIQAVAFSPDGRRLASGGADQTVKLWDPVNGYETLTLREFTRNVRALAFSPDGLRLATGGHGRGDVPLRIWNATPLTEEGGTEPLRSLRGHTQAVLCVAFSPDGRWLASGGVDKTVLVRDARTGATIRPLDGENFLEGVAFHPEGNQLAACGENGTLKVWDLRTGSVAFPRQVSAHTLSDVKYSADGRRLALAHPEGMILILDAMTGKELDRLNGQVASINVVAFSPDGEFLASGGDDGSVRLWDLAAKKQVQFPREHKGSLWGVAFHLDGKHLVTAGKDGLVIRWDVNAAREVSRIQAHRDGINAMKLSPDGRCLASASADGTVKFWDATTGGLLGRVRARRQEVYGVAFHPNGKELASADADGIVRIWAVPAASAPTPSK